LNQLKLVYSLKQKATDRQMISVELSTARAAEMTDDSITEVPSSSGLSRFVNRLVAY
jgi:hypothetical protein